MQKRTGGGITRSGTALPSAHWTIAGQDCRMMALEDSSFAFEIVVEPGQSVPMHIHPDQDVFILPQFGRLSVTLSKTTIEAGAGDLVRLPRGLPHRHENRGSGTAKALFWVSPALRLAELFTVIDGLSDPRGILRIAQEYGVDFVSPGDLQHSRSARAEQRQKAIQNV